MYADEEEPIIDESWWQMQFMVEESRSRVGNQS